MRKGQINSMILIIVAVKVDQTSHKNLLFISVVVANLLDKKMTRTNKKGSIIASIQILPTALMKKKQDLSN